MCVKQKAAISGGSGSLSADEELQGKAVHACEDDDLPPPAAEEPD